MSPLIKQIQKSVSGKPASKEAVEEAEKIIEFDIPPLLRDIYLEVANGGVGPGYKILGVRGGHQSDEGDSLSDLFVSLKEEDPIDPLWIWPAGVVPFCHWGSAIYSCYEAKKPNYPVIWFDPNLREMGEPMEQQFSQHRDSLESWLTGWLDGEDLWSEK